MTRQRVERTGKRAYRFWTPDEEQVVVAYYPDYNELERRLPHRTRAAFEARADHLGIINRHAPRWTAREQRQLQQMRADGASFRELCRAFPTRSQQALVIYVRKHGFRLNRRYTPSGVAVLDELRREASRRGMAMTDIDRQIGSGRTFESGRSNIALKHIAKAVAALGGEIHIEWHPLD